MLTYQFEIWHGGRKILVLTYIPVFGKFPILNFTAVIIYYYIISCYSSKEQDTFIQKSDFLKFFWVQISKFFF